MPSKKHPLEIFKRHQETMPAVSRKSGKKSSRQDSSFSWKKPDSNNKKNGPVNENGSGSTTSQSRKKVPPGERRFSLSLNGALVLTLVIAILSLGAFYMGYERGKQGPIVSKDDLTLKQDRSVGTELTQYDDNDQVMSSDQLVYSGVYGVQVGTWDAGKEIIAQEANSWLQKKGYDSKLYPLANQNDCIIMIGSFADREDPMLLELLQTVRGIDDYPYGSS
ncbi:MAG: hypothetical protein KJ645_06540, partial [Planctomycetes bacterium]|nr:hypothetical protein [Planctomycetota bacterium]